MARPTKYNEERSKKICDLLRAGCTRKAAYQSAGIDDKTFASWLQRFSDFSDSVTRAEADSENIMVAVIQKAAIGGDWRASESWLKRRRRDEWGDAIKQEHSGPEGGAIPVSIEQAIEKIYGDKPSPQLGADTAEAEDPEAEDELTDLCGSR